MHSEAVQDSIGAETVVPTWKTRAGRLIPICDLEDGHLLNILCMIRRAAVNLSAARTVRALLTPGPQGEMAQMAFEQEVGEQIDATWRDALPKDWPALYEEAESRPHIAAAARAIRADDMGEMQFALELAALARRGECNDRP